MNTHFKNLTGSRLGAALMTLTALALLPASALACGGFFCFTQPVDQSAERILYVQHEDKMSVHIQISYTGDDDKFSWLLPLPSMPTTGIGSDSVFQVLENVTAPRFQLQWENKNDCYGGGLCQMSASADDGGAGGSNRTKGGVTVLEQKNVGPYEQVVLKGDSGAEIFDWLNKNNYVQPAESKPLLELYAAEKYLFMALKLQKDKGAGDLAPIVVTLDESSPCLPLRLTRIAAAADMPIVAWVLGKSRAIPKNFLHVEINEGAVDWLNPGGNYKSVFNQAVDQASGHAFTTEYAQKTQGGKCYGQAQPNCWKNRFANASWEPKQFAAINDPGEFLRQLLQKGYPRTTQMQELIREYIPKPAAYAKTSDQEFYGCVQCQGCTQEPCAGIKAAVAKQTFDPVKFALALEENIVEPLAKVQAQFDIVPYLTRLFTTVSPPEMNKDPIFAFNPDLPDVDNVHTAKAEPICKAGTNQAHKVLIKLDDGHELLLDMPTDRGGCFFANSTVNFNQGGDSFPVAAGGQAARKVEVLDESGPGLEIDPADADKVDAELNNAEAGKPSLSKDFIDKLKPSTWDYTTTDGKSPPATGGDTDSSCTAGAGSGDGGAGLMLLTLLALGALVLRRERLPARR